MLALIPEMEAAWRIANSHALTLSEGSSVACPIPCL